MAPGTGGCGRCAAGPDGVPMATPWLMACAMNWRVGIGCSCASARASSRQSRAAQVGIVLRAMAAFGSCVPAQTALHDAKIRWFRALPRAHGTTLVQTTCIPACSGVEYVRGARPPLLHRAQSKAAVYATLDSAANPRAAQNAHQATV